VPAPRTPTWRDLVPGSARAAGSTAGSAALALGVELRQLAITAAWESRRAETITPRGLHARATDLLLGVRPLVRSTRTGAWIKGDASWDAVRRPHNPYPDDPARWFAELYSIGRDVFAIGAFADSSEWLTLDTVTSGLLWPHLRTAEDLGIPIVATQPFLTVTLADTADAVVEIARRSQSGGGMRVTAAISVDGRPVPAAQVRAIGRTGVYAYDAPGDRIALTLAPLALDDPLHTLLAAGGEMAVPAVDADEFLREVAPRVAQHVAVRAVDVTVPPVAATRPLVRIVFRPGDALEYTVTDLTPEATADLAPEVTALVEAGSGERRGVEAAEFMVRVVPALEARGVRVETSGVQRAYRELTGSPRITLSTVESSDPDWFDLGVLVTIDGRTIPFTPLFTALSLGRKKLLLTDGSYFSLGHPALQRLRDLIDEAGELTEWETGPRISRYQVALCADFEDLADETLPAVTWRATAAALRDVERIEPVPPPTGLRAELRGYQQAGLDWLAFLWRHRLGGILADDMGLGKTLQMLALIAHAREQGETRPFLVVAPTSVTTTWADEAARFVPSLRTVTVGATRGRRTASVSEIAADADVVITSYALLRLDAGEFASTPWAALLLDEAQFVKNPRTAVHRAAREVPADVTFAITGTPLENSLADLWSLLSLTAPGLFASERRFRQDYIGPIEHGKVPENAEGGPFRAARLARLRHRIRPLVLRRTKDLVAPELPETQQQEVRIELAPAHRALYDATLQRERQKILGLLDDLDRQRFIIFRSLTLLRMLSLAPGLVDPAHARVGSSKLDALADQLTEIVAEGHRVLVFSQFTSYLALVAERLARAGIAHVQLDGSTRRRAAVIEEFRAGEAPVFLISLKAGGFGLTLTEADYVFLLDPWWNPAAEAQAIDRTHRIGQRRTVMVYRMIAADTIEEKVMALQRRKARLFTAVMDDEALFGQALSADDIRGLLDE